MKRFHLPKRQQPVSNQKITFILASMFVVAFFFAVQSCKHENNDPETDPPVIDSLSAMQGMPGDAVTIYGGNFKDGVSNNEVTFGSYTADISSAIATRIVCTVPAGIPAGTYTIKVAFDEESATYSGFVVSEEPVAIVKGFSPDNGSVGDAVTITGANFGSDQGIIKVTINDVTQEITAFTDSTITITLTRKTFSGEVVVWVDGVKYVAPNNYNYVEKYTKGQMFGDFQCGAAVVDEDGFVYATVGGNIIKYDSNGTELKKVFELTSKYDPIGLFLAENDTMYVSDGYGRILYFVPGKDEEVKALVAQGEDPNIKSDYVFYITGDNQGNLYISSAAIGNGVTKYSLTEKSSEVIFTEPNNEGVGVITFHNERLYFTTANGVWSIKPDGSDKKRLIDDFQNDLLESGIVYYPPIEMFLLGGSAGNKIYMMDLDGTLTEAISAENMQDACMYIGVDHNGDLLVRGGALNRVAVE